MWDSDSHLCPEFVLCPGRCQGQVVLSDAAGSFNDGSSASSNIVADCNCNFLIKPNPPEGKLITGIVVILDRVSTHRSYKVMSRPWFCSEAVA